ncbi:unnamed protein product [Closterium sp. NIES-54]
MTHATRQKEKEEEQARRRATRRLSQQTDREGGGGSEGTNASAARGRGLKKLAGKKAAFGQEKIGKKAEEKGKQPTPRKRVSTVKKDADVASGRTDPGLTNDGTIGGKEDPGRGSVSLAVPSTEREGSATRGNHGDSPRAEHGATQESEAEASQHGLMLLQLNVVEISAAVVDKAKTGEHSIVDVGDSPSGGRGRRSQRKSDGEEEYDTAGRPAMRRTSGGRRGKKDEGGAGDEEEADEEEDVEEEEDEEDAEKEDADVGEEEKDENDDEEDKEEEEEEDKEGGDEWSATGLKA